jgi:hypothetical protein
MLEFWVGGGGGGKINSASTLCLLFVKHMFFSNNFTKHISCHYTVLILRCKDKLDIIFISVVSPLANFFFVYLSCTCIEKTF